MPRDDSPIERMCEVTGGRSYRVRSQHVLNQCIESLVKKVQPGVVVQFEQLAAKDLKDGEVQDLAFQPTKKMILVPKHPTQKNQFPIGFWPIPEPYWPDPKLINLPSRDAHPKLRVVTPCIDEPPMVRNFPVDKYELEHPLSSPLTLQILSKRDTNKCWPVVISNGNYALEQPIGYLKMVPGPPFDKVYLVILPYNYPVLLPLVNDLLHKFNSSPPPDWTYKFSVYLRQTPPYYAPFLRRALNSAAVPYNFLSYILPESLDNYLSSTVANFLKTMKTNAKQEQDNLCNRVSKQLKMLRPPFHQLETAKQGLGLALKRDLVANPQLRDTFAKLHSEINLFDNYTIIVPAQMEQGPAKSYRNPFDLPRRDLVDEIARMRDNYFKPTASIYVTTRDFGHCLPISEMGNYQEYLKNKETPLREIEPTNSRPQLFGNPYKKDKSMVMVDEADLSDVMMKPNTSPMLKKIEPNSRISRKRKAGPIHKDFVFRRLSTDSCSSISSIGSNEPSDMDDVRLEASPAKSDKQSSDSDESNLVIDFEFNEPSVVEQDFTVNGHIQSFINGETNDDTEDVIMAPVPLVVANTVPLVIASPTPSPSGSVPTPPRIPVTPSVVPHQAFAAQPPIAPTANGTSTQPPPTIPPPVPLLPTLPPSIVPSATLSGGIVSSTSSTNSNNVAQPIPYMNDPMEISKILQQCHNGTGSSANSPHYSNSSVSHNINSNGNTGITFEPLITVHTAPSMPKTTPAAAPTTASAPPTRSNDLEALPSVASSAAPTPSITQHTNNHHHTANHVDAGTRATNKKQESQSNTTHNNCKAEVDAELDADLMESIRQQNLQARKIIFQDIRKPGRDYSQLLEHLNLIKGSLETKLQFIQMCIEESQRFRRKKMADCIQEWWDKYLDQTSNFNSIEFTT